MILGKFIQKEICASVSSKWALKRHLRSCHTPKDLEEFEIISGKGSGGNLRSTPDLNPELELSRNSTPNISSVQHLKHESPDDRMDHHSDSNTMSFEQPVIFKLAVHLQTNGVSRNPDYSPTFFTIVCPDLDFGLEVPGDS